MEKQYYTPEISEFHHGFEYEYLTAQDEWVKDVFGSVKPADTEQMDEGIVYRILKSDEHKNDMRVKYLDREDLETLGWRVIKEPYRWQFEHVDGRYKLICDIYVDKFPIPEPNRGSIKIIDNRDADDYSIFHGYIKNKNELQKLMKQLLIL